MQITWFGHSCFGIDTGSSRILIDPFLSGNPTFEKAAIPLRKAIDGATHVALTHGHEDHVGDTVQICKATGAKLLAVHELAAYLAAQGVDKVDGGNTGGTLHHDDFDLTFVPAWHSASNIVDGRPLYLGACCGLIVAPKAGRTIYHMGDTAIFSDMGLISEIHAPKIGFVPIGDRYTMGAKTAALACKRFFHFELIVPCHYGTFPVLDQSADRFVTELGGDKVVVPKVGVSFEA
jgi:L-ascorbate metabolism protein UlaG (beta-lactamase superfamily)